MPPVEHVDLPRFMGDWYVIAHIPSWPERHAYDAVESYRLLPDGRIQTDFRYRKGSFDAKEDTMHPVATVRPDTGNAVWGMQFFWPIEAEYVIAYLDDAYQTTVIGRSKRDYVWIMARVPCLSDSAYAKLWRSAWRHWDIRKACARCRSVAVERGRRNRRRSPQGKTGEAHRASSSLSPVRMRMACSTGLTKILPSPILPVRAALTTASMAASTWSSGSTTSTRILGRKSTTYSAPR